MADFIQELRSQLDKEGLKDGEYCIIMFEVFPADKCSKQEVRFVYRNFEEFKQKYLVDYNTINEDNGIYIEWRTYQ